MTHNLAFHRTLHSRGRDDDPAGTKDTPGVPEQSSEPTRVESCICDYLETTFRAQKVCE